MSWKRKKIKTFKSSDDQATVIWWEILKFSNKMQYVGYVLKRFLLSQLSTVKLLTKVYFKDLLNEKEDN